MSPLCSRNARSQKTLVGRAQWGTHPSHPVKVYTSKLGGTILGHSLWPCWTGCLSILHTNHIQCVCGLDYLEVKGIKLMTHSHGYARGFQAPVSARGFRSGRVRAFGRSGRAGGPT